MSRDGIHKQQQQQWEGEDVTRRMVFSLASLVVLCTIPPPSVIVKVRFQCRVYLRDLCPAGCIVMY